MKIVTYLLGALLVAALTAAAVFYFMTFEPMRTDYLRMKAGIPEMDKAKAELKKYKAQETKEAQEVAWVNPAVDALKAGLSDEIKAGKAEVTAAGNGIVVNISEDILYTPGSVTFAKDSPQLRLKLAALLGSKELKGREILIGNMTDPVPAQGKGKKKIPPKDARVLAADRALALVKFLEQNKVDQAALIAAAYAQKMPEAGFQIKGHKTMIVIESSPVPSATTAAQPNPSAAPGAKPAEKTEAPAAGAQASQPKAIPLKPAQPKGQ
ncbi:MAG TPA: hypothetical protein VL197_10040 [Nitrospirota bacterium]|nr:hypothetical protein [Nitrospirota bacterium]